MYEELLKDPDVLIQYHFAILAALLFLKFGILSKFNKNIHSSKRLLHFYCPNCGELNTENLKKCSSCETAKKDHRGTSTCLFCGDSKLKKLYGFNPEFWVTLVIWFMAFMPMALFYFIGYFFKKVCRNCGHMLEASDYS